MTTGNHIEVSSRLLVLALWASRVLVMKHSYTGLWLAPLYRVSNLELESNRSIS